jgi:large subunit ribosomal protein L35
MKSGGFISMAKNKTKMKSHRGARKRFRLTATGKVKRNKAYKSHILTKKTAKRKRGLRKATLLTSADLKRIKQVL